MGLKITSTGAWNYQENTGDDSRCLDTPLSHEIYKLIGSNSTLLDFGCGTGYYVKYIQGLDASLKVIGIEPLTEGCNLVQTDNILNKDLTEDFNLDIKGNVMCIEVLEHIPVQFEAIAVNNIVKHCDNYLFVSWARVGQNGHGHFNCRDQSYVVPLFESKGFVFLEKETQEMKHKARIGWIKNNVCVFKRV